MAAPFLAPAAASWCGWLYRHGLEPCFGQCSLSCLRLAEGLGRGVLTHLRRPQPRTCNREHVRSSQVESTVAGLGALLSATVQVRQSCVFSQMCCQLPLQWCKHTWYATSMSSPVCTLLAHVNHLPVCCLHRQMHTRTRVYRGQPTGAGSPHRCAARLLCCAGGRRLGPAGIPWTGAGWSAATEGQWMRCTAEAGAGVLQGKGGMRQRCGSKHTGCHGTAAVGRCCCWGLQPTGSITFTTTGGAK